MSRDILHRDILHLKKWFARDFCLPTPPIDHSLLFPIGSPRTVADPAGPSETRFHRTIKDTCSPFCAQGKMYAILDGFVKSLKTPYSVIPVKTGIRIFN